MTTTIHTARYNGQVFTRTSKTRTYSHVVLGRESYEYALAGAQEAGDSPTVASNYKHFQAYLDGTSRFLARSEWQTEEQHAAAVAFDVARAEKALKGAKSLDEYRSILKAEAIARVEARKAAGDFDTFGVIGWTSRLDLAQKTQNATRSLRFAEVVIVEAERTTKEPKGQPKAAEAPVATQEAAPAASEAAEVAATPYQVEKLKSEGKHYEAGVMARELGLYRSYGAHYGMRSDRDAARDAFLAGYDAQVSHEDDSAFQDVLLQVADLAATHEVEQTLEGNQTTTRHPLTLELLKSILRRNGMLDGADSQGRKGLLRLLAALVDGSRIHTAFHSYKLVAIEAAEPVKTSQELLASIENPTLGDMLGIALLANREAQERAQDDEQVYDEHGLPLLVTEWDDCADIDIDEEEVPVTTVWLTKGILKDCASFAGHRMMWATLEALQEGKRCYAARKSYILAQEEADEPQDSYQGQPPLLGGMEGFSAAMDDLADRAAARSREAFQDRFDRWTEERVPEQPQDRVEEARAALGSWLARFDAARARTTSQVTQAELDGLTLVVSGAFVGTNGPRPLTVNELHFMAACEGQSARQVLERLKAGQVIEGSCTYRYLAEAGGGALAA